MGQENDHLAPSSDRRLFSRDAAVSTLIQFEIHQLSGSHHHGKSGAAASTDDPLYPVASRYDYGYYGLHFLCLGPTGVGKTGARYGIYLAVYGRYIRIDDLVHDPGKEIEIVGSLPDYIN